EFTEYAGVVPHGNRVNQNLYTIRENDHACRQLSRVCLRGLLCIHSLRLPGVANPAKSKTAEAREDRRFAFLDVTMLHRRGGAVYDFCVGRLGQRGGAPSRNRSEERTKNGQQQAPGLRRPCPTTRELIGKRESNQDGEPEESGNDNQPRQSRAVFHM